MHVFMVGDVRQFQALEMAGAERQGADPGPVDLDRQGMVGIGDQNHRSGKGIGPDDLADHPVLIEHRLPDVDTVLPPAIDQDMVPVGIEVHRQQLGDQHALRRIDHRFQQGAQPAVFRFQGNQFLQLGVEKHLFLAEASIFFQQGAAARQVFRQPIPDGGRPPHQMM